MTEAVVVGAGQAGLAVSWHLRRSGVEHVVLEQGTVGDTWTTQRWRSFRLNTPAWASLLPGDVEPDGDPGAFHTGEAWARYLTAYATRHALPIEERSPVTRLEPRAGGWTVSVGGADPRVIRARSVVVASGMQRKPRLPASAAGVPEGILSIHAADYRSPDALPPGGVLIVGGAQSGCQIAEDILDAGRDVWLAASAAPRVPRRYRGRDIFEWLLESGFFEQSLSDLPDPAMRWWPQPNVSGIGERGHTLSLQAVAARGAVLTGRVASVAGGTVHFAADLGASIAMGDRTSVAQRQRIDAWIEANGRTAPPPEPDAADQPVDDLGPWSGPDRLDLVRAGVGCVIWATGFGADLEWIDRSMLGERGLPVHVDGAAPVPGLWFLGVPWMRRRRSSIILGADEDGAFVAERVAARMARPHG